jgi:hypothetical protein
MVLDPIKFDAQTNAFNSVLNDLSPFYTKHPLFKNNLKFKLSDLFYNNKDKKEKTGGI